MKIIALDISKKRIGIAKFIEPVKTIIIDKTIEIKTKNQEKIVNLIINLIKDYDIAVMGLPKHKDGNLTENGLFIKTIIGQIKNRINTKIIFIDERYTTKIASQISNKNIDSIAASLILETYLKNNNIL